MTLDKILRGFTKTIAQLDSFENSQRDEVDHQSKVITIAQGLRAEAEGQLDRATKIKKNLMNMLEV
jgi:hypothetical protein